MIQPFVDIGAAKPVTSIIDSRSPNATSMPVASICLINSDANSGLISFGASQTRETPFMALRNQRETSG